MRMRIIRIVVTVTATFLVMSGALGALAAEDIDTSPAADGPTDGTGVEPADPSGQILIGEIRASSISFERPEPVVSVTYYFVYSGPGSADTPVDAADYCLVSHTPAAGSIMKYCAQ